MWDRRNAAVFAELLAPSTIEDFASTYYERAPLHVSGRSNTLYDRYFTLAGLEDVLYGIELDEGALRLSRDGTELRRDLYCRMVERVDPQTGRLKWKQIVDPYKVSALFGRGCTVVFDDLRLYCAPVARLVRGLEVFFGHKLFAGMFLTPRNSQGFAQHFDVCDSLILQIEGRKHWCVRKPAIRLPLDGQKHDPKRHAAGPVLMDIDLHAGDLLYIPRGTFHQAAATDDHSLHLALGLVPVRWNEVLQKAIADAAFEHEELRQSTAVALDPAHVEEIARAALSPERLAATAAEMELAYVRRHRGDLSGQLRQTVSAPALGGQSRISLRKQTMFELVERDNGTLIRMFDTEVALPRVAAQIVRDLSAADECTVESLEKYGDVTATVARLIACGLVVRHDAKQTNGASSRVEMLGVL